MYFVSRQRYWPDGDLFVEIAAGGLDYANPDMLVSKYPGEGQEYLNPKEAVEAAIAIRDAWKKDSDEEINIGYGFTGGHTMPFSQSTDDELINWAERRYNTLPKCAECDGILGKETFTHDFADYLDEKFCSQYCAEENYNRNSKDV